MSKAANKLQTIVCPNCGRKLQGYTDEEGAARMQCDRCKVVVFSKVVTPSRIKLDVRLAC